MEPLNEYEIQELMIAMGDAAGGAPIGSLWAQPSDSSTLFLVMHHANMSVSNDETTHCVVLQAIPSGEAWVMEMEVFTQNKWTNVGFVWDRHAGA